MPDQNLRVAWLAPELHADTADEGEYRVVNDDGSFGGLVTWIDDTPNDPNDGSGHFEAYTGSVENYYYNSRREAAADAARGI